MPNRAASPGFRAVVFTIPVATWVAERAARGGPPLALGVAGSVLAAVGLLLLSLIGHQQLGWMVVLLFITGAALGLGVTGLTPVALTGGGSASGRAAVTVAARDLGLVLALLVLTPIFVNQLKAVSDPATRLATTAVVSAPISTSTKLELARTLPAAVAAAPQSELPNLTPSFQQAAAGKGPAERAQLAALEGRLNVIIQRAATHAFKRPMQFAALFAILVLPLLAIGTWFARSRERPRPQVSPGPGRFDSSLRGSGD